MKEKLFNTAKLLIFAAALGQLALSQVHIGVITKVFAPSVGFFLFLFVIFGLVTAFNSSSIRKGPRLFIILGGCTAALVSGAMYLKIIFGDMQLENSVLTMDIARISIIYSILAMVIYLFSTVTMLLTRDYDE